MTSKDDGLLSDRNATTRDPSQRILAGIDDGSRWQALLSRPWTLAFAVVAPCVLFVAAMTLMPGASSGGLRDRDELPAVPLANLHPEAPVIPRWHHVVPSVSIVVAPVRGLAYAGAKSTVPRGTVRRRKRRVASSVTDDVALLSVLVEHIDAERRKSARRTPSN